jgi:hypothetical protein
MNMWNDTNANGERKHSIWREQGKWTSITYAFDIEETDRLVMDIAFNHLYYNSAWFHGMCNTPKVGIFVRNGFHLSGNSSDPHITFQFRGYGDIDIDKTYYHAYFDRTTKLIVNMSLVTSIPLFS